MPRKMTNLRLSHFILGLPTLLFATWLATPALAQEKPAGGPPPATQVGMDMVRIEPLRQTVPVIGRFVARQAGVVASRVAGPISKFDVEVGETVSKGQPLAELVTDNFTWERNRRAADVASAQADIATAEASLKLLQQELNRLDRLRTSPAFSEARYDDKAQETVRAKSQRAEAQAQLKSAEAELQLAEIALRDTVVLAPYDGTITQRHSEAGAYVQVGAPLVTMLDHNNLEIEADVPANRVPGLEPGLVLDATITDGSPLRAIVRAVIPDENPRTRTRRARFVAEFPGKNKSTAANQSVTVLIPAGEIRDVLTVHKDAVMNRSGQMVVLNDGGKATFRQVKLGEAVGVRFVVLDGLKEGDQVVVRGNERLRPGQAIAPSAPENQPEVKKDSAS